MLRLLATVTILSTLLFIVAPIPHTFAQEAETESDTITLDNPLGTDDVRVVIARFIQLITGISGSLAFAVFVWGGFNWVIAAGNEKRIEAGKRAFKYGALGLVIIFGSFAAISALLTLLGQAAT